MAEKQKVPAFALGRKGGKKDGSASAAREARKRNLQRMVEKFQSEPNDAAAHKQWKEIEKKIFGVEFPE